MPSCTFRQCFDDDWSQDQYGVGRNNQAVFAGRSTYTPVETDTGAEELHELKTNGAQHKVTREAFINVQTSLAIVSGLVMGIGVSGFFADVPAPEDESNSFLQIMHDFRLMVWCAALFGALMSTGCSVYAIIQAGFMESDDQMNAYLAVLNNQLMGGEATLYFLVVVPFIFMMLAIPQHMFLSHQEQHTNHTFFCLAMCLFFCPLPFAVWFFYISHKAFRASSQPVPGSLSEAEGAVSDMIYTALQKYVQQKGGIFAVQKKEFLQFFHKGEVEKELADMIFDDWKQQKLKSMLREEPGF